MTKEVFIRDVMAKPATIAKSAKITEALDKMLDEGIDPLIAVNNNSVVGTVSRKAIAEKLGSKQNSTIAPTAIHVASVVEEEFTSVYPDESINVLIPLLQQYKLVVVYDADHKLIGQVGAGDLLKKFQPEGGINGALEKAVTIEAEERVVHLRRRMLDDNITRFIVSEKEKYTGIVTETDVAIALRKFRESVEGNHQDHRIRNLLVKDIMSSPLVSVERTAKVSDIVALMLKKNISSVPVMDKGKLAGIVTRASLVKAL
ncbi:MULTISPECIES: CBS domain-containing protein [unclassified Methanoregula]|uniref:CBS domain-containing protein n=1 Tax=unclassified Methanoregula TaxID=2649730 RepID=UPI0009D4870A|nr:MULTISPECIES: CBS domain-containing protein [unclassified Methanoregula]OPX64054.1 MAG: Inosine-5'-monophosphate dehydrogenase [Methanoregula sp. PtaB.Bin085]OPY33748.1 MAG: Inosine-5'-monophosphate dehydrogenase [Methanoregula sp. PtaU1.Bin006]